MTWAGGLGGVETTFYGTVPIANVSGSWIGSGLDSQGRLFEFTATLPQVSGTSSIYLVIEGLPSSCGSWTGLGGPDPLTRPWSADFDMHSEDTLFDGSWGFIFDAE